MAPYDQILLFGDSLFQQSCDQDRGFTLTPALQHAYQRRLDVVNRGFNGYNTAQALPLVPNIVPPPENAKIRMLLIWFGANDACLPDVHNTQHVPRQDYESNLRDIITHPLITAHRPKIMIITPPPIDEHAREMHDMWKGYRETRRTAGTTRSYAETARKVGHEQDVAVLDLWNVFMSEAGWKPAEPLVGSKDVAPNPRFSELMHDGLHLNPEGYRVVFREVMKTIHQHWPDQDPEQLPLVFPIWEHAPTTSQ